MEIPPPPPCPPRFKAYLESLRQGIFTVRPIQGNNISVSEFPGQGSVISADTIPGTGTNGGGGGGGSTITVTVEDASGYTPGSGVGSVSGVTTLTFDQDMFEIFDGGGGQCVVRLKTCDATCGAS